MCFSSFFLSQPTGNSACCCQSRATFGVASCELRQEDAMLWLVFLGGNIAETLERNWTLCSPLVIVCTTRRNFKKFYILPTHCIYGFCEDFRKKIISPYNINWLVFITETECVYCAVRTGKLNIIQVNVSFLVLELCLQTAIICLSIFYNWDGV
jgi:hypothetical protein